MKLLKLELRKTDIRFYCFVAIIICSVLFLHYAGSDFSGSTPDYKIYLGFCLASCMVKYRFRGNVQFEFPMRFSR